MADKALTQPPSVRMALLGEFHLNGVGWGGVLRKVARIPAGAAHQERRARKKKHGQQPAMIPCPSGELPPPVSRKKQVAREHQGFFSPEGRWQRDVQSGGGLKTGPRKLLWHPCTVRQLASPDCRTHA